MKETLSHAEYISKLTLSQPLDHNCSSWLKNCLSVLQILRYTVV